MIAYLAVFALGVVLGALATLCVVDVLLPPVEPFVTQDEIMALRKAAEIRRRFESECI